VAFAQDAGIANHPRTVPAPHVKGPRVSIPTIEFFFIAVLFEKENVGAEFREFQNIVC